tara:strand:- start:501 stop:782 length:282 start_codon:yes stop_codon:yes gene_type:complete
MDIEKTIKKKIDDSFNPIHYQFINFSSQHKKHYHGNDDEVSHVKLLIVSKIFEDLNKIDRERKVHKVLKDEISKVIHSLRLKLYTEEEYKLVK